MPLSIMLLQRDCSTCRLLRASGCLRASDPADFTARLCPNKELYVRVLGDDEKGIGGGASRSV